MLHEEDDPLSSSMFNINTSHSILGNTLATSSMFSYEEDPWGNHSTPSATTDINRSSTTPNLTNIDMSSKSNYNSTTILWKIAASQIEMIMQIVVPNGASYVTQSEFNTAIALLACAQNNIDISLESLYRNKNYLPQPIIHSHNDNQSLLLNASLEEAEEVEESTAVPQEPSTTKSNQQSKSTMAAYPGMKSPKDSTSSITSSSRYERDTITSSSVISTTNNHALDTSHWFENLEEIAVTIAPEREGFIFKHVNYIITNEKRSSIVLRRYSDFWWLMEVLLCRYPFRIIPNLPPKKLGGRDTAFLEKRRKGLSRFINAIVRHPVLRHDEIVERFLTEPSELLAWRKQNPPNLDEEYKRKSHLINELENITPTNLEEQLQKARKRVTAGIHHYVNLCFIMERMIRRMHGQATDFSRYSIALNSLAEAEIRYHAGECRNCQRVVRGYETVAKHMQVESSLLEDQVNHATDGVLENLKRFRDLLVSFRDLDERRNKLSINQTDVITKRIQTNRTKVHQNKGVPGLEAEVGKLEESIRTDELELADIQNREIFIRYCIWSELTYLHKQQAFISSLYQSYVKDAVHFSKQCANNWQILEEPTFEMPANVELFE
ncbi:uncharacterized protein BX663DRAFT_484668 [Cokeromyces recurvatus]|uniref:uncharacterized protein n=1 Tax=Cokeromyces recurvatus TaxID=90255 RepID=UPI00222075FB|nr:uncharacterized protein BX663DRAFT_484668 [Cokeromyces recurvatus]KAI7904535.1 hypothetical protein BX663DRAFT_484668 [Cokeromyces recurvatus]